MYTLTTSGTSGSIAMNPSGGVYNKDAVVTVTATRSSKLFEVSSNRLMINQVSASDEYFVFDNLKVEGELKR